LLRFCFTFAAFRGGLHLGKVAYFLVSHTFDNSGA
jgi:hypothetical protein